MVCPWPNHFQNECSNLIHFHRFITFRFISFFFSSFLFSPGYLSWKLINYSHLHAACSLIFAGRWEREREWKNRPRMRILNVNSTLAGSLQQCTFHTQHCGCQSILFRHLNWNVCGFFFVIGWANIASATSVLRVSMFHVLNRKYIFSFFFLRKLYMSKLLLKLRN